MCPIWSLLIPNLQYKLHIDAGLRLQALNRLWVLSPHLSSWALTCLTTDEVNPAQIGRFTPSSNIPNSSHHKTTATTLRQPPSHFEIHTVKRCAQQRKVPTRQRRSEDFNTGGGAPKTGRREEEEAEGHKGKKGMTLRSYL